MESEGKGREGKDGVGCWVFVFVEGSVIRDDAAVQPVFKARKVHL